MPVKIRDAMQSGGGGEAGWPALTMRRAWGRGCARKQGWGLRVLRFPSAWESCNFGFGEDVNYRFDHPLQPVGDDVVFAA